MRDTCEPSPSELHKNRQNFINVLRHKVHRALRGAGKPLFGRLAHAAWGRPRKRRIAMKPIEAMIIIQIIGLVVLIAMTIYYNRR